ncbi:MAG: DUF1932 domain-containing protein [Sphingobium sp.]
MSESITFIGFGEAGQAFARPGAHAFDIKTRDGAMRAAKLADYRTAEVSGCDTAADALTEADAIFSLVTADQALGAARNYASLLPAGALWLDMNSVAPATKRAAALAVESTGGRYVDVAVMAPVLPARLGVPLLVSGPHADEAAAALRVAGFTHVSIAGRKVGDASAIKMIRSVMVKGLEALSAECILAAHRAGVTDAVLGSLDDSWKDQPWQGRADYNLNRMLVHGLRRAVEMEEVARTLEDLGIAPTMTRATIALQREIGGIGALSPDGLLAKLNMIEQSREGRAA